MTSMRLRPSRSPKCPKIIAPMGRATNATPSVPNDAIVPAAGPRAGKNRSANTREAATAYSVRS